MMLSPRWRKILRDLFQNKARAILTVVSIAIGVLAIGFTNMAQTVLDKGMATAYQAANPSQVTFVTSPFQAQTVREITSLQGVAGAQGRTMMSELVDTQTVHHRPNANDWQALDITALPNFKQTLDKVVHTTGALPKRPNEMLLDETSLQYLNLRTGQKVWVQLPDGQASLVRVTGTVHDAENISTPFSGVSYGFIQMNQLPAFRAAQSFNSLSVQVTGNRLSEAHIEAVAQEVRSYLRNHHVQVLSTTIPQPGKYWAADIVQSMTSVLKMIGLLDAVLGVCLVFNTVLAALTGQIRQIGMMKTFGASVGQLMRMYLGYVTILSLAAMLIGVPCAVLGMKAVTAHAMSLLGIATQGYGFSFKVWYEMIGVGLVLPMIGALYPVLASIRISIREALSGQEALERQSGFFIHRITSGVKGLPVIVAMALRNTFRRKGRLALTIFTLALGGAVVMASWTVQSSLNLTVNRSMDYTLYDMRVTFSQPVNPSVITPVVHSVRGISNVQYWGQAVADIVRPNGVESSDLNLLAAPPESNYIRPQIIEGRWLKPEDTNAIVIDSYLLHSEPDIHVGQVLTLDIGGHKHTFHVVGMLRKVAGEVDMYVMPSELNSITGNTGFDSVLNIRTHAKSSAAISHTAHEVRSALTHDGEQVASIQTTPDLRGTDKSRFSVVLDFLKIMSILIVMVSGLGLMGTQSLNVLERTREVGIMRSIGASTFAIWSIVLSEGLVIGAIGWGIASLLSVPISDVLSNSIGQSLFLAPINYRFAIWGIAAWFVIACVIAALSSLAPARNATRLTIRDVLAHDG